MKKLSFSFNWNNKLQCKAFTTLRLSNRLVVGDEIQVDLKGVDFDGTHIVKDMKVLTLASINDYVGYLDTGYNAEECRNILKRMYSAKKVDWTTQPIYFYLIVKK
jgi:hypothetical protein